MLLALLLPATANAHDFEVDGIYYNINDNQAVVTFKGSSVFSYSNEYSGNVTIPATVTYNGTTYSVTSIGDNAFYRCSGVTSIDIGNSVTTIGDYAFSDCSHLTEIYCIALTPPTIESCTFSGCYDAMLFVPKRAVNAYITADYWGSFT